MGFLAVISKHEMAVSSMPMNKRSNINNPLNTYMQAQSQRASAEQDEQSPVELCLTFMFDPT